MKRAFALGLATVLSINACQKVIQHKQPLPETNANKLVNNPSSMKQKIIAELGILDVSKMISDLNELKAYSENIAKN